MVEPFNLTEYHLVSTGYASLEPARRVLDAPVMRTPIRCHALALVAALLFGFAARDAKATEEPGSYVKAMQTCDGLAIGVPLVLSAVLLGGQGALYLYAKVDSFFRAEPYVLLGAVTASAGGYVACGPATHLVHGHPARAAVSALIRPGFPAAAITLSYLALRSTPERPGEHIGPSGGELVVGVGAAVAVVGSFAGALLLDYGLAAEGTPVTPAIAAVPGGMTGGLSARW